MLDAMSRHGIRTQIVWEDGVPIIKRTQDVRGILEQCARERSAFDPHAVRRNAAGIRPYIKLPWIVIQQLEARGIMKGTRVIDQKRFREFVNSSEVRNLRTDDGRRV